MQFQIESRIDSMEYSNPALRIAIGNRLRHRRELLGLSQKQLEDVSKVGQSQISKYETENSKIDAMTLARLADALGVSTDWLLGLDENPKPVPTLEGDESELLALYRSKPGRQEFILRMVREL